MSANRLYSFLEPVLAALALYASAVGQAGAAASAGYWQYFVPGDEVAIRTVLADLDQDNPRSGTPGVAVIGVSAWSDDTTLYYDHWENGYSFDPDDPSSVADEVVVLRASSVTTACTEDNNGVDSPDCQTTEAFHVFDSPDIPSSGWNAGAGCSSAEVGDFCYGGGDRIFVAGGNVTVSRATWILDDPGTLQALAWEVYPVRPLLTTYILPFGEDLNAQGLNDFERVFSLIQATTDNSNHPPAKPGAFDL